MKLKLPSLRVTQRSTTGKVVHRLIPRGCTSQSKKCDEEPSVSDDDEDSVTEFDDMITMDEFDPGSPNSSLTPLNEPSLHLLAQKAAVASWKKM